MKLLTRYLIRQLCSMTLYALLALLALYSFFDIISEVGDIGQGSYNGAKMMQYVLMQMPAHAYELLPLAVLIGGLIALSQLASGSELTVMKASGMSTKKLIAVLLQFGLIFAVATALLGEWLAPAMSQRAENLKASAISGKISTGSQGLWLKEGNHIINVREMLPDHTLLDVKVWRHDAQFRLAEATAADSATVGSNHHWLLKNVRSSILEDDQVRTEHQPEKEWAIGLQRNLLDVLLVDPEQMSVSALTTYITHLKDNQQQTRTYEIAWWRKLMYPVAAMIMALVALSFTPQSTRHGNMGLKLFFGICLGLAFHFAGRLFGFTSQLYNVPPFIAAVLPTLLFGLLGVYLIRRQERR
ncbi:LPS export ABC transporter permease LptG [Uruburuella suis]|jgi:lipopolysaccharide export system permease protein|uniref:LPS export ABC transporter permease LptG n=1 Tax=Uruburuella suis TaxID=252130 RepID=A0AAE9H023_9NEIS|nr:LPS export ABC transporter permease LptG [Uruburuella suis]MBP6393507.1 LPS export ABC transporter permease LptG [Neisseria sp.]MBP8875658.1 LPS export ABC transporter permease LptG [Neisseria sp.]TCP06417.1 lipopolysaccharide export system permease protein [Uruburuella suis]UOO80246.1 LPS export ABC transporter permease LptG [Uruburuella suis]